MASKEKRKKASAAGKSQGANGSGSTDPHSSQGGCNCEGCLRMLAASGRTEDRDPFNLRFAQMRQRLEKCVRSVPSRLLKPGFKGPALQKCLQDLTFLRMEEEYDQQLKEAHALAKYYPARPILAAGLYSEAEECQVSALMCFYSFVKDGDFERAFPPYCNALQRHSELLDSEDFEVVSYAAMSIATLGNSPYFCDVNPTGGLQHRFYEVGAVHKMMALMNKQPSRRKQRGTDSLEVLKMECCYALAGLLANYLALRQPWVPERVISEPGFIEGVIKLTHCPQKGGEVQRMALMCLGSIAQMTDEVKAEVVRLGGKEAAEKALKAPFADASVGRDQETKRRAVIVIKALMSVAPAAPLKKPLPSADDVSGMSVRELKDLLTQHNVSTQGCVEKADLQAKVRSLLENGAPKPATAAAEKESRGSSEKKEVNGVSPEKKEPRSWGVVDRKVNSLPSTVEVLAMPTKEILAWLKQLEISTEGCLERQDLALKLMATLQTMHTAAAQEEDDAAPPTLDLAPPADDDPTTDATSAALMDFFNTATNAAARLAAEEALAQLSVSEDVPADISLERAIQLVVKGKTAAIRRMGLTVVVAAIDMSGHELRHRMDAAGVLKATVRLLHERDRPTRWHVIEALCTFAKSPSLAPKIWGYGAMAPVLEEVKAPDVLRGLKKQKRGLIDGDAYSLVMLCCLRLLANMLIPASMEEMCKPAGGTVLTSTKKETANTDAFTRKLGRWLVRSGVHSQINDMLALARSCGWTRAQQNEEITISVVQQGGRILQLLVQNPDVADDIFGLPDIVATMAHFAQQYRTSPEECAAATIFLTHLVQFHEDRVDKLWSTESMAATAKSLKESFVSNALSPPNFTSRSILFSLLEARLAGRTGVKKPPSPGQASGDDARSLCQRLAAEKSVVGAEYTVRQAMQKVRNGEVTQEELYEAEFWPLLARHVGSSDSMFLAVQFAESFALTPKASANVPPALVEPTRSKVILQVLEKGVVKALEPRARTNEGALFVMTFYGNMAQGIPVRDPIAKAILTDPDLMPFLLRFGLLEEGCKLGIATAKHTLNDLFKLNPASLHVAPSAEPVTGPVWLGTEERPGLPSDSIRYDYDTCHIYVGPAKLAKALANAERFLANAERIIDEYKLEREAEKSGPACGVCGKSPAKSCSRCHKQSYCGRDCQTQDWKQHKKSCKAGGA